MKKTIIGVSAGLALCLSSFAFASGDHYASQHHAKSGFVVGVDAGFADYNMFGTGTASDISYNHFATGAYVGYNWALTNHPDFVLGGEVGYKWLGRIKDYVMDALPTSPTITMSRFDQQVLDVLLSAKYYVYQGFNIFTKAGLANVYQKTSYKVSGIEDTHKLWGMRPEVAIGVGYSFYDHLDVHLTYDHIASDADSSSIVGSNSVLAGLSFAF